MVLIAVAAIVCGCASGPATSPPQTGVATGSPTAGLTDGPDTMKSSLLFDIDGLSWFEYRMTTMADGGKPVASDIRFDYTTSVVNSYVLEDHRVTMKMADLDVTVIIDKYYDPATDKQVGGHVKMVSEDVTIPDLDVAMASDQYRSSDVAGTFATGDWPLASLGTETVTIDGKAYPSTKYSVGNAGEYGTAWVSEGVPVPVKIESKSVEGTSTWELIGWG
jgi:hypothetical protein